MPPGSAVVRYRAIIRLNDLSWETLSTTVGDGTRKQRTISLVAPQGFYRITSQ